MTMSENFLSLSTHPMMIQLFGKNANISCLKKQRIGKVESFLKPNFDLNQ